jgi:hypothetical protein
MDLLFFLWFHFAQKLLEFHHQNGFVLRIELGLLHLRVVQDLLDFFDGLEEKNVHIFGAVNAVKVYILQLVFFGLGQVHALWMEPKLASFADDH